ncbi:hypothetical protein NC653_010687 [Populus alba x Populus x berolinensis]|uniref:Uncharacterized protein n=1 Tax=Populus alba x Populus x berolinensis TaxID=444605 RepID=A0AAD6R0G7_9ROSI|nr:hypothetical protein NC653_010687 [Populus alba x Populus x berolinensis]
MSSQLLCLNAFRGEPPSSGFKWHFTPNHNSSTDSSTSIGLALHLVSPKLHPGHEWIAQALNLSYSGKKRKEKKERKKERKRGALCIIKEDLCKSLYPF